MPAGLFALGFETVRDTEEFGRAGGGAFSFSGGGEFFSASGFNQDYRPESQPQPAQATA